MMTGLGIISRVTNGVPPFDAFEDDVDKIRKTGDDKHVQDGG